MRDAGHVRDRQAHLLAPHEILWVPRGDAKLTVPSRPPRKIAVLHQGCVPVYRRAFFEHLARASRNTYQVFYGTPPSNTSLQAADGPFSFPSSHVQNHEWNVGGSILVYQPVLRTYLKDEFDGAIIGHEFKFISSLAVLMVSLLLRRPVIWWGFGFRKAYGAWQNDTGTSLKDRIARWAADRLAKLGSGYLVYTEAGRDYLLGIGIPENRIQVLRNTIDVEEQIALSQTAETIPSTGIRSKLGLSENSHVLVYIGRLVPRKQIDLLIRFGLQTPEISGKRADIVIIGDGSERRPLEALANGAPNIHFLGALDPTDIQIAEAMKIASAVVIPGYLGLAVNHAFAHGKPVITRDHDFHSPEIEYLTDNLNGLMIQGDENDFLSGVESFLKDPDLQRRLAESALETRETLRLKNMVSSFDGFVSRLFEEAR